VESKTNRSQENAQVRGKLDCDVHIADLGGISNPPI
jgi:hypothetical protein